jgi:lipoyl(octanoyl) transferase
MSAPAEVVHTAAEPRVQSTVPPLIVRRLGCVEYEPTWRAMQEFTASRGADTPDEIWLLEHPPVFTQGLNGRREHVLAPGDIPVVQVDRGGQVTYHGPGQLVVYPLLDLKRYGLDVRSLVVLLENAVIALCAAYGTEAVGRRDAPGVYVDGRKLASVGLRIKRNCSYHGLALNVVNDLEPFRRINPCGYAGLQVVKLADFAPGIDVTEAGEFFAQFLLDILEPRARQLATGHRGQAA